MPRNSSQKAVESMETDESDIFAGSEEWKWETAVEEEPTLVIMDTVGDVFIGQYKGEKTITPDAAGDEPFTYLLFRAPNGMLYSFSKSYKLGKAFENITPDTWCRITYMAEIPVKKGNPLKDYRVDVRK